jgi:arginine repressor
VTRLTASTKQRLKSINIIMDDLYSNNAEIYESLVDMEFEVCHKNISKQIKELKRLQESLRDEL